MATTELVVPRSMPMILDMVSLLFLTYVKASWALAALTDPDG